MSSNISRKQLMEKLQILGQTESTETALFHQAAASKLGLGIMDVKALSVLLQEGSMIAGQLSRRLGITTGAVTNLVDRLEEQKLLVRTRDPHDRRKVIIALNKHESLMQTGHIYESMGRAANKLFSTYSEEQVAFLVEYYEAMIELTKAEIAKLAQ